MEGPFTDAAFSSMGLKQRLGRRGAPNRSDSRLPPAVARKVLPRRAPG